MDDLKKSDPPAVRQHLVHSHAHEEDLPGTVNLLAAEGDDTGYGQALFPVPANDPNDPLQWSNFKKIMILIICSAYSFLGNSALVGPAPYLSLWAESFNMTVTEASGLINYPNLAFGFGSIILVPLYLKFGRRPVMLGSILTFAAGLIGASQCNTYAGLMAARCIHGFGSGVCEALPVQLVNDIFFLHERGKRIGYYTVCLCLGTFSPLPAGYMLAAGNSWRLLFYVLFAFSMVLFILAFLFVEETSYDRKAAMAAYPLPVNPVNDGEKSSVRETETAPQITMAIPPRKTFLKTLSPKGKYDPTVPFFTMMARSFTYFLVPQALWVITTFGIYIGLGAFVINFTFPIKIVQPPYNWDPSSSGLISLAAVVGYAVAIPFTSSSDRLAARLTRKNGGIREAEMRLGVLLPAMVIGPVGLIIYGFTAQQNLHWMGYFAGAGMLYWAAYFFFSFTLAYAVDSYYANTSEMLIAMNIGKQAISFGFGIYVLTWVLQSGYEIVIAGIFTGVLLANNLILIVFMIWGKRIRRYMYGTWLARMHWDSIRQVETH